MKFIIKLFPEITVKSNSVRLRFIKILTSNIRHILNCHMNGVAVLRYWDYIEVSIKNPQNQSKAIDLLIKIPGIHHILLVDKLNFSTMHNIFEHVFIHYQSLIINKTFCVRVKRRGNHPFTSTDVERYVGSGLNQHVSSAKVKLTNPDITVYLDIEHDKLLLVKARYTGLGGFPIGTQNDVISLISGGYDSGVSSYMAIRRGCRVHYCFFNLGGHTHEIAVKQMACVLWRKYGSSHKVRFISINFTKVIGEIVEKIDDGQMGVVLKRMMVRAASQIAEQYGVNAIVTGEALGQVSSQTLINLRLIDNVSDTLVLRPLITHDKETIIKVAREIGIEEIAKTTPEFCGVISRKPTAHAIQQKILAEENQFNFDILDSAIRQASNIDIRDMAKKTANPVQQVDTVDIAGNNDVIIDIRTPEEQEKNPLVMNNAAVISIPFYKLTRDINKLDPKKNYLLYCEQGTMSKLQASYLLEHGFTNIRVLNKS